MYLLMIFTFIIGTLLSLFGSIGKDLFTVASFLISDENLSKGEDALLVGSAEKYIDICLNGNGSLSSVLDLDISEATSVINTLNNLPSQIDNVKLEFEKNLKSSYALQEYQKIVNSTKNYESDSVMLYKKDGNLTDYEYYNLLKELNENTQTDKIYDKSCSSKNDSCITLEKEDACKGENANTVAKKDCEILNWMVQSVKNIYSTEQNPKSLDSNLADLKDKYDAFLQEEVGTLNIFKNTITDITDILNEYIGNGDPFSFLNCNFVGTNIKILLKYLGEALGSNIYTVGKFLLLAASSMLLSISFTILEVIIINKSIDTKIKENGNKIPETYGDTNREKVIRFKIL